MDARPTALERGLRGVGVVGLVVLAALAGWRLLILEAELASVRVEATRQLAETRQAQAESTAQLSKIAARLALLTAEPARPVEAPEPGPAPVESKPSDALARARTRIAELETQLQAAHDDAARKARAAENERVMLRAAQAALVAEKNELTRRLADLARRAVMEPRPTPKDRGPRVEGAALSALVKRLDEQMSLADKRGRLRFISAKTLSEGGFEAATLTQRDAKDRLIQRVRASKAVFELYQEHRLLRVRLTDADRTFGPASARPGHEMRLPALVLELYDVDVKGWRELARDTTPKGTPAWLELR